MFQGPSEDRFQYLTAASPGLAERKHVTGQGKPPGCRKLYFSTTGFTWSSMGYVGKENHNQYTFLVIKEPWATFTAFLNGGHCVQRVSSSRGSCCIAGAAGILCDDVV